MQVKQEADILKRDRHDFLFSQKFFKYSKLPIAGFALALLVMWPMLVLVRRHDRTVFSRSMAYTENFVAEWLDKYLEMLLDQAFTALFVLYFFMAAAGGVGRGSSTLSDFSGIIPAFAFLLVGTEHAPGAELSAVIGLNSDAWTKAIFSVLWVSAFLALTCESLDGALVLIFTSFATTNLLCFVVAILSVPPAQRHRAGDS